MRLSDLQEEVTNLFKNYSLTDLPEDIRNMAYLWFAISHRSTLEGDQEKLNIMIARLKQNGYTARVDYDTDEVIVTKGRERYTDPVEEVMIRLMSMAMKQDNSDIDEGMGGSTGGGTAGSAGAGGSSLGLPYPSTYEEEYDKFKNFHPINKNKRPMHNLSLTTEEQQEMFTDHDVMQLLMKDKEWPEDLQTEVLRKYAGRPQEGENFIDSVEYEGTKKVDNYGLLQNTDNMFILAGLPQTVIKTINETWGIRIKPSKYAKMSDLEFKKWVNTPGYVSQPTVVIDSDVVLAEGKWIASIIRGEKSKLAHVLSPGAPKVKKNEPNQTIAPAKQKELAFVESEEDKLWKRDELPQLSSKDFEDSEYTLKKLKVSIDKLKPVQNERVRGLVKKTIKMLKSGKEKPIVVDKFGYIVNGHHRYDAYTKLGVKTVPVLKVNATIEELIDKYM
tara:strand:- start:702 stop:2036 length:1335 start_codon:yes stop_codon:yes gene_type:complete